MAENVQATFTIGPWKCGSSEIDENGFHFIPIVAASNEQLCAMVYKDGCGVDADEAEANAKLISVAPEMLESLKELYEAFIHRADLNKTHWPPSLRKASELIKKATGA